MASKRSSGTRAAAKTATAASRAPQAGLNALGFALQGFHGGNPAEVAGRLNGLAALCDRAADHMALAHNLLSAHELHTETAIGHLDAALGCLQQITAEGLVNEPAKAAPRAAAARSA